MAKYVAGEYQIMAFDNVGRQDRRFSQFVGSYAVALRYGEELMDRHEIASFVVVRVIYNSIQGHGKRWLPKQEDVCQQ